MSEVLLTRMSSKGQIVVPKELRDELGLTSGQVFLMFGREGTIVLKKVNRPSDDEFEALLKWGQAYAKKRGITRKAVLDAIEELRHGE